MGSRSSPKLHLRAALVMVPAYFRSPIIRLLRRRAWDSQCYTTDCGYFSSAATSPDGGYGSAGGYYTEGGFCFVFKVNRDYRH